MILEAKPTKRIGAPLRVALSALAVLLLLSFPTRGVETPSDEQKEAEATGIAVEALEVRAHDLDVERLAIEEEVERLRQAAAERGTEAERRRLETDRMRAAELEQAVRESAASAKQREKDAQALDLARLELERARRAAVEDRREASNVVEDARAELSAEAARLRQALAEIERRIETLEPKGDLR